MWRSAHTLDTAAWTGIAASFMHLHGGGLHHGKTSRVDIWRLRHDCHEDYPADETLQYSGAPINGREPCGNMALKDVNLELCGHVRCGHRWKYGHWTWPDLEAPSDTGFCSDSKIA